MSGSKRKEITDQCPDEFKDVLTEFIDTVESEVKEITELLDISNVSDLCQIDEAYNMAASLAAELY